MINNINANAQPLASSERLQDANVNTDLNAASREAASGVTSSQSSVLTSQAASAFGLLGKSLKSTPATGAPVLENENGAPTLPTPNVAAMGMDELMARMQSFRTTMMQQQVDGTVVSLNRAMNDRISQNKERSDKMLDQMAKATKAMHPHHSFWSWIVKIVMVVVAVVAVVVSAAATAVTGGAAAPLLAISVMGLAAASTSLASQITGKPFSLSSLLADGISKMLQGMNLAGKALADKIAATASGAVGMASGAWLGDPSFATQFVTSIMKDAGVTNENVLAIVGAVTAVVAAIASAVATAGMSSGAAAEGAASAIAEGGTTLLQSVSKGAKLLSVAVGGVGTVVDGVNGIRNAGETRAAADATAEVMKLTASTLREQATIDQLMEKLRKLYAQLQEGTQIASNMISTAGDERNLISSNMSGAIGA